MAVLSAEQPEFAFKISAPDLIVLTDDGQGLAIAWCSAFSFLSGTRPSRLRISPIVLAAGTLKST
ncbi:hypothetical protein [Enterobacter kobei]|uniref:hypothetical protein n=1 Tax=Enterobacter kobei TaxID=208224 RepID=UPI003890EF6A